MVVTNLGKTPIKETKEEQSNKSLLFFINIMARKRKKSSESAMRRRFSLYGSDGLPLGHLYNISCIGEKIERNKGKGLARY